MSWLQWANDPISPNVNDERMKIIKISASNYPRGNKNPKNDIWRHHRSLTSDDLGWPWKGHNVNVSHVCHLATYIHVHITSKNTEICKLQALKLYGTQILLDITFIRSVRKLFSENPSGMNQCIPPVALSMLNWSPPINTLPRVQRSSWIPPKFKEHPKRTPLLTDIPEVGVVLFSLSCRLLCRWCASEFAADCTSSTRMARRGRALLWDWIVAHLRIGNGREWDALTVGDMTLLWHDSENQVCFWGKVFS